MIPSEGQPVYGQPCHGPVPAGAEAYDLGCGRFLFPKGDRTIAALASALVAGDRVALLALHDYLLERDWLTPQIAYLAKQEKDLAHTLHFGMHRGRTLAEVPVDYLIWLERERPRILRPAQLAEVQRLIALQRLRRDGKPSTREDRRRAVVDLLLRPETENWSDRRIGRQCGVNHKTVGAVRRALSGEIPQMGEARERVEVRRGESVYTMRRRGMKAAKETET